MPDRRRGQVPRPDPEPAADFDLDLDAFDDEFDGPPGEAQTHRGGFGDFAGDNRGGLIDRAFRERIVLVGTLLPGQSAEELDTSLDELAQLVDTAGADAMGRVIQRRHRPDPATFVGSGKVAEIRALSEDLDADTVVFDDDLTPAQQRNLEKLLGRTALDRTAVILDIFAQNAASPEGKAQVELAQLRYRLPRLRRSGGSLSQQGGGIGTRGPGETQLEVDRRRLVRRIHKLESQLIEISRTREVQRKSRQRSRFTRVALVGYTNSGKSTLLNRLTSAGVLVEDRLFATLDATTRKLQLPGGETVLLTDTVGFVKKLPHHLVESFKTTLDVVVEADLLVHLVDAAGADPMGQMQAVRGVLAEIGAGDIPELLLFNKADTAENIERFLADFDGSAGVSALSGAGIEQFLEVLASRLRSGADFVELHIPYARGDLLAIAHREGEVVDEFAEDDGYHLRARLDPAGRARLAEFVVASVDKAR